jgi:hypothetical protein
MSTNANHTGRPYCCKTFYWETNITHSYLLTFISCLLIMLDGIANMIVSCCVMYLNTWDYYVHVLIYKLVLPIQLFSIYYRNQDTPETWFKMYTQVHLKNYVTQYHIKWKQYYLKLYFINKILGSSTTSQIWKSVFLATNNKIWYRTQNSWRHGLRNL